MDEFRFPPIKIQRKIEQSCHPRDRAVPEVRYPESRSRASAELYPATLSRLDWLSQSEKVRSTAKPLGTISGSRSGCEFSGQGATKPCAYPRERFPRTPFGAKFSSCEKEQLYLAYVRSYRMASWALDYMSALKRLPARDAHSMWHVGHFYEPGPTVPATYFGAYTRDRHRKIVETLEALVFRYKIGVPANEAPIFLPLLFERLGNSDYPCDNGGSAIHYSNWGQPGHIGICPKCMKQPIGGYARILMHECMHKLVSGVDDIVSPQFGTKAYEDQSILLAQKYPDLAVKNIDCYTMWSQHLLNSIEKRCALFPKQPLPISAFRPIFPPGFPPNTEWLDWDPYSWPYGKKPIQYYWVTSGEISWWKTVDVV